MAEQIGIIGTLVGSGRKFEREMAILPSISLQESLKSMRVMRGIRGEYVAGFLHVKSGFRPYKTEKGAVSNAEIVPRTSNSYHGDVVHEYDPASIYETIYGQPLTVNKLSLEVVKAIALEIARKNSESLGEQLFKAVRNPNGTETADLFDGFDTICEKEITAGNISAAKGNFFDAEEINTANVGDKLREIYKGCNNRLKKAKSLSMFLPTAIKEMYEEWFIAEFGAAVYNTEFEKSVLHGTQGRVKLVDLEGQEDSNFIYLTPSENMLVLTDGMPDGQDTARLRECDNPKVVQFFAETYFGVNFNSIDPRMFKVAKFTYETEVVEP